MYARVTVPLLLCHHYHEISITQCTLSLQFGVRYAVKDFMVRQKSYQIS